MMLLPSSFSGKHSSPRLHRGPLVHQQAHRHKDAHTIRHTPLLRMITDELMYGFKRAPIPSLKKRRQSTEGGKGMPQRREVTASREVRNSPPGGWRHTAVGHTQESQEREGTALKGREGSAPKERKGSAPKGKGTVSPKGGIRPRGRNAIPAQESGCRWRSSSATWPPPARAPKPPQTHRGQPGGGQGHRDQMAE